MAEQNLTPAQGSWTKDLKNEEKKTEPTCLGKAPFLFICVLCGFVFGFALEKGRVFEPSAIRLQMVFEKWIMMKMFLAAMATGALSFGVLSLIPIDFVQTQFAKAQSGMESVLKTKNSLSVAFGAFILGVGMTLSGACPGMVLPQVGAWAQNSIFTLIGALVGNLIYGLLHDRLYEKIFPPNKLVVPTRASELTGIKFAFIALPMGIVVFAAVILLEILVPWKTDVDFDLYSNSSRRTNFLTEIAWPPSICGAMIGALQIVFVLSDAHTLGGSGSYNTLVAQLFCTETLQEKFPYLAKKRCGPGNWWQVFYVFGGILGGAVSAISSDTWGDVPGVPIGYALVGGVLLLVGARLAAGCTSGHGLSGSGLLFVVSFIAVPCMFGGAIGTGFILKATNQLYIT